jgi:hypothetical protein
LIGCEAHPGAVRLPAPSAHVARERSINSSEGAILALTAARFDLYKNLLIAARGDHFF